MNQLLFSLLIINCFFISILVAQSDSLSSSERSYSNENWGIKFSIPEGVDVFTTYNPGTMSSRINSETPLWLVSSSLASERINLKLSQFQDATEKELDETKQELESGNLYSSIPQYQKLSVRYIKIGKQKDKKAIEHLHSLKQKEPKKLRQIMFLHKGRVFNFTCATSPERFDIANQKFFELIFNSMEFK